MSGTPSMQRLAHIGMNCGCEYTGFHLFRNIGRYSRLDHSIGAGLIVWHFTENLQQSAAALLHDIATPSFAHVVDFLHCDHEKQESTEDRTLEFISNDSLLVGILEGYGLKAEDVADYHRFPIADNDTPQLSSDRLEYTCGNVLNYGFADIVTIRDLFSNLEAGRNERGLPEIVFTDPVKASLFARLSLQCSKVYVCDADRFAMQRLAEILAEAIHCGILSEQELYLPEEAVIEKIESNSRTAEQWRRFKSYRETVKGSDSAEARTIKAKKRRIDPFVPGKGRVTEFDAGYRASLQEFLDYSFDYPVYAV